jgi:hypothetical protein
MNKKKKWTSRSVYMPMKLAEDIEKIAKSEMRTFSFVARRMLETHPDMKKNK